MLVGAALWAASPALAHDHHVPNPNHDQVLANGNGSHNAPDATFTLVCGGDPAWYGLETAHHGPDSGTSGPADGCYQADADIRTDADDQNPAIE
jgi:hypothetical protein